MRFAIMPTLHVRDVPEEMYERIRRLALARNRSLGAEVVTLLDKALAQEEIRQSQAKLLTGIRRRRQKKPPNPKVPDSLVLLREDRAR